MTGFEKHQDVSSNSAAQSNKTFIISYLIKGVALILVSMRLEKAKFTWGDYELPILNGTYLQYTTEWYLYVGSQLCFTIFISIVYDTISKYMWVVLSTFKRLYDRGCKKDRRQTKKFITEDYEALHVRNEFQLDKRYSRMLVVVGLVFLFSSGIAILYPIALGYFVISYFVDKF
jgi:hypothetical protein